VSYWSKVRKNLLISGSINNRSLFQIGILEANKAWVVGRGAGTFALDRSIGPLLGDHLFFQILAISFWYHDINSPFLVLFILLFALFFSW